MFGDALLDILRAAGIGPSLRWVDDFIFFLLERRFLEEYNRLRERWRSRIASNGGRQQKGGRFWYRGDALPNDQPEEFVEDMSLPLKDLFADQGKPSSSIFSYSMENVDAISARLGVPWEHSKDIPFGNVVPFIGFEWDLDNKTVKLQEKKKQKYLSALEEWRRRATHTLDDVQRLYGKLLHTCLVVPEGRAYLTKLEKMLGVFHDAPHKPRHPPRNTDNDLLWWLRTLSEPILCREIPGASEVIDVQAFSDASSSLGIRVVIRDRWRAWALKPGWNNDEKDITWAEAVGMELLVRTILDQAPRGAKFKIYGDNRGVVEGWWSGRSRNTETNEVFKRLHSILRVHGCEIYTRYVPSASNPADGPSRGVLPSLNKLLPPVELPPELEALVFPFDHPNQGFHRRLSTRKGIHSAELPRSNPGIKEHWRRQTYDLESHAWELFEAESAWKRL